MTTPAPPAHVAPFVEALGVDGAITFLMHFGGAEMFIPRDPKGGSELARVMGMDAARALSAKAQEVILPKRIPTAKPWIAAVYASRGLSKAEIARRLHVLDTTVRRWLADAGAGDAARVVDERQSSLF